MSDPIPDDPDGMRTFARDLFAGRNSARKPPTEPEPPNPTAGPVVPNEGALTAEGGPSPFADYVRELFGRAG